MAPSRNFLDLRLIDLKSRLKRLVWNENRMQAFWRIENLRKRWLNLEGYSWYPRQLVPTLGDIKLIAWTYERWVPLLGVGTQIVICLHFQFKLHNSISFLYFTSGPVHWPKSRVDLEYGDILVLFDTIEHPSDQYESLIMIVLSRKVEAIISMGCSREHILPPYLPFKVCLPKMSYSRVFLE